jgi:hypothetical protein
MITDPSEKFPEELRSNDALARPDYFHAWRALRHRNFRLFLGGKSISLIGKWMTRIATAWLVYRLTKSALLLGTVSFVGQIPMLLLAPFAGVLLDRLDRRQVLVWTQALAMVRSLALAWLTLTHRITIREVLALSAFQGAINAFEMPGRQAFMVQMVEDRGDLPNAIAINSSMVNLARLIGPSLAGLVIAATNEGWCFLIDGVSYIAVIISLLLMRVHVQDVKRATMSMLEQLREGWQYVSRFVPVRSILLLVRHVKPDGDGACGSDAGLRGGGAAGRAVYPGLSDERGGCGGADLVPISGPAQVGARFVEDASDCGGNIWRRAGVVRDVSATLALPAADGGGGLRHDAGTYGEQHNHSDARTGGQAWTGDELLYGGVCRHCSLWQPAGR